MSVEGLLAWAAAGGAYFEPIEIRVGADGNRSAFARREVAENELIVSVPRELILAATDAASSPVGVAMQSFASVLHSRFVPIAAWVATERRAAASRWRPYVEALPTSFVAWTPERIAALEGTRAGNLLADRVRTFEEDWALLADLVDDVATLPPAELEWGLRVARSRCFDVASGGPALVPVADMFDHASAASAAWTFRPETARFEILATRAMAPGDEVRIRYGTYDNAHWLAGYGFVLEDNPDDEVTLRFASGRPDVHVGSRFDARFQHAVAIAHDIAGDDDPRAALRILGDAARRANVRIEAGAAEVAGDEHWNRMCRIVRAGERAVLAEISEFVARAEALVTESAAKRDAVANEIAENARGADRLLRGFLLAAL